MLKEIKKYKSRKGFTLIELVLVIAIIGVLATIIIPKFTNAVENASNKADIASARTIASAVSLALTESDESIKAEDINKYLSSDIKVTVGTTGQDGWSVIFNTGNKEDFRVLKDGKELFPNDKSIAD